MTDVEQAHKVFHQQQLRGHLAAKDLPGSTATHVRNSRYGILRSLSPKPLNKTGEPQTLNPHPLTSRRGVGFSWVQG